MVAKKKNTTGNIYIINDKVSMSYEKLIRKLYLSKFEKDCKS